MVPDSSLSVDTVAGPREEFVGKSVGVPLEARLNGDEAFVEVLSDRSSVPHRRNEYAGDEREQCQAKTQGNEPRHVSLRHRYPRSDLFHPSAIEADGRRVRSGHGAWIARLLSVAALSTSRMS